MKLKHVIEEGEKVNRLKLIKNLGPKTKGGCRYGLFECNCGVVKEIEIKSVCTGKSQSCGCLSVETTANRCRTHGGSKERLYSNWEHMKDRCYNKNSDSYADYGGRGITICDEWRDYGKFREWALANGYEEGLTVERKYVNGNYEPSNCEFIPNNKQSENTRRSVFISAWGESKQAKYWEQDPRCIINRHALKERIKLGWKPEEAMTTPYLRPNKNRRYE